MSDVEELLRQIGTRERNAFVPSDDLPQRIERRTKQRHQRRQVAVGAVATIALIGAVAGVIGAVGRQKTGAHVETASPTVGSTYTSLPPMQAQDEAIFRRIKEPGNCHHYNGTATYTGYTGVGLDCDTSNVGGYRAVYLQFDTPQNMKNAYAGLGFQDDLRGALPQCSNTSYPPPSLNGGVHGFVHCPFRSAEQLNGANSMCKKGNTVDSTAPHDPKKIINELLNSCSALIATTDEGQILEFAGSDTPDVQALYNWWINAGYVGRAPTPAK